MDEGTVLQVMSATFLVAAKICAPLLIAALLVGLVISLFQAVTQINDSTVSFLPKLLAVGTVLWLAWPWLSQEMLAYTARIFYLMEHAAQ